MYRLMHKLFGWDYVLWSNSADQGIARVWIAADGFVVYWRYRSTKVLDCITPESVKSRRVIFLTCHSDKYIGGKV